MSGLQYQFLSIQRSLYAQTGLLSQQMRTVMEVSFAQWPEDGLRTKIFDFLQHSSHRKKGFLKAN
jgi:hypothetical protein